MRAKLNNCIDCGAETKGLGKRCYACSKTGKRNPMTGTNNFHGTRPTLTELKNRVLPTGKKHWKFRFDKTFPRCVDCNKTLKAYKSIRCRKCRDVFQRGKNSPRFGKIASHGKGEYYKNIYMRSSYETAFAKWCDKNNIKWQYEPKTFDLGTTTYTPDFYVPIYACYIEIKGWWRDDAKKKFKLFKKLYTEEEIVVLTQKELKKLKVIK